jgi:hypothetical protein
VCDETSAQYLIGVEATDDERDGQPHAIRVTVTRLGARSAAVANVVIRR